jgi:hypothetical protein
MNDSACLSCSCNGSGKLGLGGTTTGRWHDAVRFVKKGHAERTKKNKYRRRRKKTISAAPKKKELEKRPTRTARNDVLQQWTPRAS